MLVASCTRCNAAHLHCTTLKTNAATSNNEILEAKRAHLSAWKASHHRQSTQSRDGEPFLRRSAISHEDIPLECIARGPLCAYNNDGVPTCGDPAVSVRGTGRSDDIWVEWSDPRPPKPDVKPPKSDVKPTMPINQRRGSAVAKWEYFDSMAWQQV
jgi:hypothetical protein